MSEFKLIMISAMYENGGNTCQRYMDGHPELYVYPFESQLGTPLCNDYLSSLFPFKYRWPEFRINGSIEEDFELFFDEELKTRIRAPNSSKFRDVELKMCENERKKLFLMYMEKCERTRANLIKAFFKATFEAWKNINKSGKEKAYVGYSPIIAVDGEKILADFPDAHIIHVVRNPYSAYAETKKRPFPLSLRRYITTWNIVQYFAIIYSQKFSNNFHIIRYEDMITDPRKVFTTICNKIGISFSETILYPSWNGKKLDSIYPWGTIRIANEKSNKETMMELTKKELEEIKSLSYESILKEFKYDDLF